MRSFIPFAAALLTAVAVHAETATNFQSPLGLNLQGISYYSTENPFLNVFKNAGAWVTSNSTYDTGEEAYLQVDSDGYPTTLTASTSPQKFTFVQAPMLNSMPLTTNGYYPSGQYIVTYAGTGTLAFAGDAVVVSSSPGKYVLNVATPSATGIFLQILVTDPAHTGDYIHNIQVVKAENAALLSSGQVFNPTFLSELANFHTLRFMDWLSTNNNPLSSWSSRPLQSNVFWGTNKGVPLETAIQAANAVGADAWFNVPHQADNNYITQMATLVHAQLGSSQLAYVEFSNEVWNSMFSQANYAQTQGQATFATGLGSPFDYNRNWYGMRVAQMCDIWKSTWGADASRVVCVMGASSAITYSATESLQCPFWIAGQPCSGHGIGAVAIAPYWGGAIPSAWTSQSDGGLSSLFTSLTSQNDPSIPTGGWLAQVSSQEQSFITALAPYKLPLLGYEGGQSFQGFPNYGNGSPMVNLFIAANKDARMGTAYTTFLSQWKANGGTLFMNFTDTSTYDQYGEWGALQSFMQPISPLSSAPPKWQALQSFIYANSCWWSNCKSTIASTTKAIPMAPTNLRVQ